MQNWHIDPDADDARAYMVLSEDRIWNGYSIADLEPPFRAYTRVALARRGDAAPASAVLILQHPAFSSIVPHGDPEGVAAIFTSVDLPEAAYCLALPPHIACVERHFAFDGTPNRMYRMHTTAATFRPAVIPPVVVRLGIDDLAALQDLYAAYDDNAFNADQLAQGVFYGVRGAGGVLAAGGTHVVSTRYGIAAVGNIYTRPEARGKGLGQAITAAVVSELLAGPYKDVILNVAVANEVAGRLYRRLGFREHCVYFEGSMRRR